MRLLLLSISFFVMLIFSPSPAFSYYGVGPSFEIGSNPYPLIYNPQAVISGDAKNVSLNITTDDISGIYSAGAIITKDSVEIARVVLYDDGTHNDGAARDGIYGFVLNIEDYIMGTYNISFFSIDLLRQEVNPVICSTFASLFVSGTCVASATFISTILPTNCDISNDFILCISNDPPIFIPVQNTEISLSINPDPVIAYSSYSWAIITAYLTTDDGVTPIYGKRLDFFDLTAGAFYGYDGYLNYGLSSPAMLDYYLPFSLVDMSPNTIKAVFAGDPSEGLGPSEASAIFSTVCPEGSTYDEDKGYYILLYNPSFCSHPFDYDMCY